MGDPYLISAFAVCVLGGLGSVQGALVGGIVYGVIQALATSWQGTIAGQQISGSGLSDAIAFVVLLLVLIVRPTGLLGRATA
jgi:branched-chain amino acid transport system permease protein